MGKRSTSAYPGGYDWKGSKMNQIPFAARLVIVILLAVALSEAIPEIVNAILILILAGLILGHYRQFSGLANVLGDLS